MKPGSFDKGTEVTFLQTFGKWTAGLKAVVQEHNKEAESLLVAAHHDVEQIKTTLDAIKGKGSKEKKEEAVVHFLDIGMLSLVPASSVTKQRMRFVAVRLNPEDVKDDAKIVAKQIVEIHQAAIDDYWPQTGAGVRFPKSNCGWCEMRGHCLKDDKLRDSVLVQISTPTEDWLDDVPEEE
jgi:dihydroxyacetone kinase DhaKLM complex PTS-EIIA-like component DhaM